MLHSSLITTQFNQKSSLILLDAFVVERAAYRPERLLTVLNVGESKQLMLHTHGTMCLSSKKKKTHTSMDSLVFRFPSLPQCLSALKQKLVLTFMNLALKKV